MNDKTGLYKKYNITKADGSPTDPNADYFVLRLDKDAAARAAVLEYIKVCLEADWDEESEALAVGLMDRIAQYDPDLLDDCPICHGAGVVDYHDDLSEPCPICGDLR